jgi:plasmid stabilization system protein ParE
MEFRLKITIQARRDFNMITRHIGRNNPRAAIDFGSKLLIRAESLTTFPNRHGSWAGQQNIRKVTFDPYVIYYKIYDDEQVVEILRFWHGARDQRRLRLKEEPAQAYNAVKLELDPSRARVRLIGSIKHRISHARTSYFGMHRSGQGRQIALPLLHHEEQEAAAGAH